MNLLDDAVAWWVLDVALWRAIDRYADAFRHRWSSFDDYAREIRYAKGAIVALEDVVRDLGRRRVGRAGAHAI